MSERQGVEIDYCPQCRGIWLDRGELDKIMERAGPTSPAPQHSNHDTPYEHDHDYHHDHKKKYKHKKRKSFIEDLFDF